jgi:hypothetical protein
LIEAEGYIELENGVCIDDEEMFIREIVRLIVRYKSFSVLISGLKSRISDNEAKIASLSEEVSKYKTYIQSLEKSGGIIHIFHISPIPDGTFSNISVHSVDGKGVGAVITITDGRIKIIEGGHGYIVHEIIKVTIDGVIYYFKVGEIAVEHVYAAKIDLDTITFSIPIWIRIYKLLYPTGFDICIIQQIKNEITNYGIQYVILKHKTYADDYDTALGLAF